MTRPVFLSTKEVAARYGVDLSTVWRWRRDDSDFPEPLQLNANTVRFKLTDLEAWEESKREGAA